MTEDKKRYLRNLEPKEVRYKHPSQLPNWVKTAVTKYELGYYKTLAEAAEDHNRAETTLQNWRATPAVRKWIEQVNERVDDPSKFAEMMLRGSLMEFSMDFVEMWEAAYDANDYAEIRKMFETVVDRVPGTGLAKKADAVGNETAAIQINIQGADVMGDSEFEAVEAEWEEVDED